MNGTSAEFGDVATEGRDDWPRRIVGSALAVVPVALMALAVSFIDPRHAADAAGRVVLTQWSRELFAPLMYGSFGTLVALAVLCFTRLRWRPYAGAVVVACLICFGCWGFANLLNLRSHWISERLAVTGPDGATYRAGGDGDGEYWVVRDLDARWDRTVVEIVAGEFEGGNNARVVRPAGESPQPPDASALGVRIDAAGRVYVLGSGEVLVAYDPRGRVRPPKWTYDDGEDFRRRGMTDAEISPFALLAADATGDDADVRGILASIAVARDSPDRHHWAPAEATLLAALDDPNPWIAETARKFVREGGATLYPTAIQRLPR